MDRQNLNKLIRKSGWDIRICSLFLFLPGIGLSALAFFTTLYGGLTATTFWIPPLILIFLGYKVWKIGNTLYKGEIPPLEQVYKIMRVTTIILIIGIFTGVGILALMFLLMDIYPTLLEVQKFQESNNKERSQKLATSPLPFEQQNHHNAPFSRKKTILYTVLVIIGLGILGHYFPYTNDDAIERNNQALELKNNGGNQEEIISLLEEAVENAQDKNTQINTLKNLAYYEEDIQKSIEYFNKALELTARESFEYYLISGEIASLEGKPSTALESFKKAYHMDPKNFQVNNSLGVLYLGTQENSTSFIDYPKALSHFQNAYQATKDDPVSDKATIHENLGIAYLFNEDYNNAVVFLEKTPYESKGYLQYFLGLSYFGKENLSKGKAHFKKAKNLGAELPPDIESLLNE